MDLAAEKTRLTSLLGAWGTASTATGTALALWGRATHRPQLAAFGRQTAMWGAIDSAIAGMGVISESRRAATDDPASIDADRRKLQLLLKVNSAADVAYIAGGTALVAATLATGRRRVAGMSLTTGDGIAIIVQGSFLLALDLTFARRLSA